jgi:hypothetical protein
MKSIVWLLLILLFCWSTVSEAGSFSGQVVDAVTGSPLSGARLWDPVAETFSAEDGSFSFDTEPTALVVRHSGYRAQRIAAGAASQIRLEPVIPKALYLSYWGADSSSLRNHLIQLLTEVGMNALVIDLKSVRGDVAYRSKLPLAQQVGAQRVRTLKDLPELLAELKQRGVYTIARMTVFKDDKLARGRSDLAVRTLDGDIWQDKDGIAWSDPLRQEVRDYNLALAEEVAALGFDEIQFDYIRFPAKSDLRYAAANSGENRVGAINSFLEQARERLASYPVMTSANIFGYICWKPQDDKIGQRLADLAARVDYLSPMLYPSGFAHGIPGYSNPVDNNYEVILHSLQQAVDVVGIGSQQLRPWLQAFRDYAFDRRQYSAQDIQDQIRASEQSGSHGWMLWNAASYFTLNGIMGEPTQALVAAVDENSPEPGVISAKQEIESLPTPELVDAANEDSPEQVVVLDRQETESLPILELVRMLNEDSLGQDVFTNEQVPTL